MKFYRGLWHYQGRVYDTLGAALAHIWQEGQEKVRALAGRQKEAAPVLEHRSGRTEQVLNDTVSVSSLHENRRYCQV